MNQRLVGLYNQLCCNFCPHHHFFYALRSSRDHRPTQRQNSHQLFENLSSIFPQPLNTKNAMTMDIDPPADDFEAKTTAFANWLKESQLVEIHPSVQIRDLRSGGAGRGLVTTVPLAKDELIFSIPRSNVITVKASRLNELIGEELHSLESPWLVMPFHSPIFLQPEW